MASTTLILPEIYVITGEGPRHLKSFLRCLQNCINEGARLIQLRIKQISKNEFEELATESLKLCHQYQARLLLNSDVHAVTCLDADGIHLSSLQLLSLQQRPLLKHKLVAASCHNEREILHAKKIAADFITLSPVASTSSHPGCQGMGWKAFADLASQIEVPVFALGGVSKQEIAIAKQNGGHGVAGISAFWGQWK